MEAVSEGMQILVAFLSAAFSKVSSDLSRRLDVLAFDTCDPDARGSAARSISIVTLSLLMTGLPGILVFTETFNDAGLFLRDNTGAGKKQDNDGTTDNDSEHKNLLCTL